MSLVANKLKILPSCQTHQITCGDPPQLLLRPADSLATIGRSLVEVGPSDILYYQLQSTDMLLVPAKLDPTLMKEPRATQGTPRATQARTKRKPVNSMLGLAIDNYGEGDDDGLSKQISTDSAAT